MADETFFPINKLELRENHTQIEIKWPNGNRTLHEVTIKVESFDSYCSDAGRTLSSNTVRSFIDVPSDGAVLREIALDKIGGITARITYQGHYSYVEKWRKNNLHMSKADDVLKREIIEDVTYLRGPTFYAPDKEKPVVCCPNCTRAIKAEDLVGKKLYATPQWYTTIEAYKMCPFCEKANGLYCVYNVPEKPKPIQPRSGCEKAKPY